MEKVRDIGFERRKRLRIDEPYLQMLREIWTPEMKEIEEAAFQQWLRSLTPEEKSRLTKERGGQFGTTWQQMIPKEKYEALNKPQRVPERFFPARTEPAGTEEREPVSKQFTFPIEQQVEAPVTAMAEEIQVKETPVEIHHHQTVVNHNYDSSMRFYPRIGDDERGPRFEQV